MFLAEGAIGHLLLLVAAKEVLADAVILMRARDGLISRTSMAEITWILRLLIIIF